MRRDLSTALSKTVIRDLHDHWAGFHGKPECPRCVCERRTGAEAEQHEHNGGTDTCERPFRTVTLEPGAWRGQAWPTSSQQRSDDEHSRQRSHVVLDYYRPFTRLAVRIGAQVQSGATGRTYAC